MLDRTRWETREKVLFSRHGQTLEAHKYAFTLYVEEKQAGHRPQLGVWKPFLYFHLVVFGRQ